MHIVKRQPLIAMFLGMAILFVSVGLYAETEVKDEIRMENDAYEEHEKSIHVFTHKKHATEYAEKNPDFYKNGCGECHHDDDNKPLKELKEGDEVKNCIECHKKPAYIKTKERRKRGLKKKDVINEYHANAVHQNCQSCHRKYNRSKGLKSKDEGYAPTKSKCKTCHPKK